MAAASEIAQQHGYVPSQITINVPPDSASQFFGEPGHLQVTLSSDRGSYFAGVLGLTGFRIATQAVAANIDQYPLPFSILSLNSGGGAGCKSGHITGNGAVNIEGDVMVSATCTSPGALAFDGNNVVVNISGDCATAGTISTGPSDTVNCGSQLEHQTPVDDPLKGLNGPTVGSAAVPNPPTAMVVTGAHAGTNKPPSGCPGSTTSPPTQANPAGCDVHFNRVKTVRIYPGVYWGGLKLRETSDDLVVYMEPGIYYMAGGGFEVAGAVNLYTVDPGGTTYATNPDSGVMIFNTDHPGCSTGSGPCIGAVDFQNTSGGTIQMRGYHGATYEPLLIYQDRDASNQPALKLEGNTAMTLSGAIYLPEANFDYAGNSAGEVLGAQVICDTFKISGNGGLTITYDPDEAIQQSGTGLVQ